MKKAAARKRPSRPKKGAPTRVPIETPQKAMASARTSGRERR